MKNKNIFIIMKDKQIKVKSGIRYEDNDFCVISNQQLYDLNHKKINLKKIISFYENNIELANVISNTFTVIIVDKNQNKVICSQDLNGDTIPVYYYRNNDELLFSNKIINIVNYCSKSFNINNKSVEFFLKKGYIPNKQTLITDINKLIPKYNLIINLNIWKERFVKKKIKYIKIRNYNTDLYIDEFKKILYGNEKGKKVFTTLSNGYDSNFIFSFLNKKKNIEAFSIGGICGRDETQAVLNNVKNYKNTNLNLAYVDENTLDNYPDLISRLEGAMYERGIFLQYELSNSINKKKHDNVILFTGDGADQIFSGEYYEKEFYFLRCIRYILSLFKHLSLGDEIFNSHIKGGFLYIFNQYKMLTYIITKKNGILMNDINVSYVQPYLSRNIINIGYLNRHSNIKKKKSHIKACKKEIDPNIMKNIANVGGTTEPIALFKNCKYIDDIESFVDKSKYNILKINSKSFSNEYLDYLLKVLYLEVFEYLFIDNPATIDNKKSIHLSEFLHERYS